MFYAFTVLISRMKMQCWNIISMRSISRKSSEVVWIKVHFNRDWSYSLWTVIPSVYTYVVFVPRFRESVGTLNLIRLSVRPSVCLSVRLSVTNTLTLAITFALLQIELWYLASVFFVTRPFRWYNVVTVTMTFDLLQGQICCRAGDHNSLNLRVAFDICPIFVAM